MAKKDKENEAAEEPAKGGMGKMLMAMALGGVLLGAGVVVGSMFLGGAPAEPAAEAEVEETLAPAIYQNLHPPLVINFPDEFGEAHFMQISMEVMSRDQEVINAVREHTPVIRSNLILQFSNALYEEVATREGKEKMLADGLEEIQRIMTEQIGEPGVEALYFTSLVIQ